MDVPHRRRRRGRPITAFGAARSAVDATLGFAAGAAAAGTAILAVQAGLVAARTPRLPPPPQAGTEFPLEGLLAVYREKRSGDGGDEYVDGRGGEESYEEKKEESEHASSGKIERGEFNLVLVGDSPVEGIGCSSHPSSLGGRTALAFSRLLGSQRGDRGRGRGHPVRYWSFGRSGLTAAGIEAEMVPLLRDVVVASSASPSLASSSVPGKRLDRRIDAVVVSCGVNNVLSGHSASRCGKEVRSLIRAVRGAVKGSEGAGGHNRTCQIVLLGLPDFSRMPFLPYPLSAVSGWRGRVLQTTMKELVEEMQEEYVGGKDITIATVPEVEDVLGSVQNVNGPHYLLNHLDLDSAELVKLDVGDLFADDGFHPARHGTILLGTLIAQSYAKNVGMKPS